HDRVDPTDEPDAGAAPGGDAPTSGEQADNAETMPQDAADADDAADRADRLEHHSRERPDPAGPSVDEGRQAEG
ncbi:MAG: hypothetical protein JXA83_11330, partial [Acidimicrobiales bacterium]|nr:hypothetical protein [Acidimicrobiales bacterium]